MDVVVVNPATVLGSGLWGEGTSVFFKLAWDSFGWYAKGATSFVDVRDVVKLMTLAMNSEVVGERFILSSEDLTYKQLMEEIAKKLNRPPATKAMKRWMEGIVWRWAWFSALINGMQASITKETTKQVGLSYTYNNSKSIRTYNFTYLPILKTIEEVAEQFKIAAENECKVQVLPLN